MSKKRREKRQSAARRRAETRETGFSTTKYNLPQGLSFYKIKEGTNKFDIVPFCAGADNPQVRQGNIDKGDLYFERTFWEYQNMGPEQERYIAPGKSFGKKDFVQDWIRENSRSEDENIQELIKVYSKPKERQVFLVWDHNEKEAGLKLFEYSAFMFGSVLDDRIKTEAAERNFWDEFYYPDEGGFTLEVLMKDNPPYGLKAAAIDFIARDEPLPKDIGGQEDGKGRWTMNHGICLDDGFLVELPYKKLKSIFLQEEIEDDEDDTQQSEKLARGRQNDGDEEETDSEPEPEQPKPTRGKSSGSKASSKPSGSKPTKSRGKKKESKFAKDDVVEYDGKKCEVLKISDDGTSYTLMDMEDDEIIKAIGEDELKEWEEPTEPDDDDFEDEDPSENESDDDDWDDEFD